MDTVRLAGADVTTSCLGFGCASLGSRISPKAARAALEHAFDAGVTWYDVAPAYGAGTAEFLLGEFVKGKADQVSVCTKVGLIAPNDTPAKRMARALIRPLAAAAKPVRDAVRGSGLTANRTVPLTPELVRSSLDNSLKRLGVDQVALYALHNAKPEDMAREEIRRALEDLLAAGKVRAVGVTGVAAATIAVTSHSGRVLDHTGAIGNGPDVGLHHSATDDSDLYSVVQFAQPSSDSPETGLIQDAAARGMGCVTHSVFGALHELKARLAADPALARRTTDAGFADAASLLLARARAANPRGVVLASMASESHLRANLAALHRPNLAEALRLMGDVGL